MKRHDNAAEIRVVWRAADPATVIDDIAWADHIIFACLAIRAQIERHYTFLKEILESDKPISAIAVGTELDMFSPALRQRKLSSSDLDVLRSIASRCVVFTTRGLLTQSFCEEHQIGTPRYTGDVAFGPPNENSRSKELIGPPKRIVVSDPHYSREYPLIFSNLIFGLTSLYPDAEIECALHGLNDRVVALCNKLGLKCRAIYDEPDNGLSVYDYADIHVGFRVHGHVTALSKGLPSYLLEQDGRGADYGTSLAVNCSTSCYRARPNMTERIRLKLSGPRPDDRLPIPSAVSRILSMISHDSRTGFARFDQMPSVIDKIRRENDLAFSRICSSG